MATRKIGRYQASGSNGHFVVSRWDGDEYRAMHNVPSYTTMSGAVRKATQLNNQDKREGINTKI